MKLLGVIILSLFGVLNCVAQGSCGLNDSPPLLGLRLNMSPEQAQSAVGKALKIKFKTRDEKIIFQNYIDKPSPSSIAGVRALYLRFVDQKLYQIEVFYEEKAGVKTLQDFTTMLSSNWNYPGLNWQIAKGKAMINCGSFTVVADKVLNPHIELTDETERVKVEEIRNRKDKKN